MRGNSVEEQIQWILSYMQKGSTDIWKENILEDLKVGNLEYETTEKFLADLKKEFGKRDDETMKVMKLKKVKQWRNSFKSLEE